VTWVALGLAVAAVGSGLIEFLVVRDLGQKYADARADAEAKAGRLAIATADVATWKARAGFEERRADALDDLIAKHADVGPVAGSMGRLLDEWRASKVPPATGGPGSGPMPAA